MSQTLVTPADPYNQTLVDNVHPSDWENPTPNGRYNMVIIGGGTAGLICAGGAAGMGAKVALIEKHLLGGDCLNFGCVPSKSVIRSGRAIHDARNSEKYGTTVDTINIDFSAVMQRMRRQRSAISSHDSAQRFTELGVDVFLGKGTFTSETKIQVGEHQLDFSRAVIATGARARLLKLAEQHNLSVLTNETVFSLTELPKRLTVIGAGPIGCELAQAFSRLGSEVTIIGREPNLLPREDSDASSILSAQFQREGIVAILGADVHTLTRHGNSDTEKVVICNVNGKDQEIVADEILLSIGRIPNTENLGLDLAGVEANKTGVVVNSRLRTSNRRIYAAGDVCSKYKFTHAADAMARIVIQNSLFLGRKKASSLVIPWCTFTDPEIAHVGISQQEAVAKQAITQTVQLKTLDRAFLDDEASGFARVHTDRKGTILGATLVASHAGEMIAEMSLAMTTGQTLGDIAKTIHPYPTQSEVWKRLGDEWNRNRLTPFISRLFRKWLSWRR